EDGIRDATVTGVQTCALPIFVLDSVTKQFRHRPALFNWLSRERSGETLALVDVFLRVQRGKVLLLLGPNGSGKTTTLKLISTMRSEERRVGKEGRYMVATEES